MRSCASKFMGKAEGLTGCTPFSFICDRCGACCRDKSIMINPYEIMRLSSKLGMSTTDFLSAYATAHGTELKRMEDGACVFATPEGCRVYDARPLVCRLYPLGRHVSGDDVTFSVNDKGHSGGIYGSVGTVADYLKAQGAEPYVEAVDRYLGLFSRLLEKLVQKGVRPVLEVARNEMASCPGNAPEWLDADIVIGGYCRSNGITEPSCFSERMLLHIHAMDEWVKSL